MKGKGMTDKATALYHVVYAHETFDQAAKALLALTRQAQETHPGEPRRLYLHRQDNALPTRRLSYQTPQESDNGPSRRSLDRRRRVLAAREKST